MTTFCSPGTGNIHTNIIAYVDSTLDSFEDDVRNSIDLVQHVSDDGTQDTTRSLFIEKILEVSFSKDGQRLYRVQWEPTWETEEHLLITCKDILRAYWEKQTHYNIVFDKDVFPEHVVHGNKNKNTITMEANSLEDQDVELSLQDIESSLSSQAEPGFSSLNGGIDGSCEVEGKMTDIPEQYKNIGFAKSVRENFGKVVPCGNKFDFVEHYLSEKLVVKPQSVVKKVKRKVCEEKIKSYVSYRNGTRVSCNLCQESFADQKSLASHKICWHDKFSPHQCNICLKMFAKPGEMRRHMTTHSPRRSYYCYFCEKTYKTKNHLQRHIKAKHSDLRIPHNEIQVFVTDSCDPNDLTETVVESLNQEDNIQYTNNSLTDDFNEGDPLNALVLTDSAVLFQDTLHNEVVLQQPVLTETFLTTSTDEIQMSLIDKADNFFNCTSFTEVSTLLET